LPKAKLLVLGVVTLGLLGGPGSSSGASKPRILCTLPAGQSSLAPGVRHGLASHLRQYPDLSLATSAQRLAAARLLQRARAASARWQNVKAAKASGFHTRRAKRATAADAVGYLHAEHRRYSADRRFLDPRRPEALIYATTRGHAPVLIGVMFSMPRDVRGATPAGPIDRWHAHLVCEQGHKRGLTPLASGNCPRGSVLSQGSEMLHLWFTRDLRSAFAVHAPVPELCRDGLLTDAACRGGAHHNEM
jgi:hypothetical protein